MIVGWSIETLWTSNIALNALDRVFESRKPSQTVIHSDHGTEFTSGAFTRGVREAGLVGSSGVHW